MIENDLRLLQRILYLHQQLKLSTFCTNTRQHYCLGTVSPRTSTSTEKGKNPASERSPLTISKGKKLYKSACVSALTGSVPRKMAQRVWAPSGNWSHVACLTVTHLNHWAIGSNRFKTVHESSFLATCNCFLRKGLSSLSLGLLRSNSEYLGQIRCTRIIEHKSSVDTSYRIRHRLELKYFTIFARFLLIAHQTAHRPRKSEN